MSRSEELFCRATQLMPGGVNSPVRACSAVGTTPRFIARAKGSRIYDVDGKEYIDYVCSWGPCILGHAHPAVVDAVTNACVKGLTFGAPTEAEVELAELIHELMPSMELSRMVNSGTEAVMSAVRVARGFTKRAKIIKFRGCYHGHSDSMLVKAGSGALTSSEPDSAGVTANGAMDTLVADYNDKSSVQRLFNENPNSIAAVIVEPVAANMGVVLPKPDFLPFLRDICTQNNSLLIFDEVITGFRLGLGGAQQYYGVTPDLTTLGKIVGGGMPAAVYGGRKDIMRNVAPDGKVYQAGTLSGNPLATAAGIATLKELKRSPNLYSELDKKTARIEEAILASAADHVTINRVGSLMSIFFKTGSTQCLDEVMQCDTAAYGRFYRSALERGIYLAPSQFEAMFVSAAHTDDDIERTIDILKESL